MAQTIDLLKNSSFEAKMDNVIAVISKERGSVTSVNGEIGDVVINVPTNTSDLVNDSGYVTEEDIKGLVTAELDPTVPEHVKNITETDISNWNNKSDFDGDYDSLINKPTKLTDFENDLEIAADAANLTYDNAGSRLESTNVQDAIDELANSCIFVDTGSGEDTGTLLPVDADTLEGHPASYFATAESVSNIGDNLATVATTGNYNDLEGTPDSLPASDVSEWAKATEKPSYTYEEVGADKAGAAAAALEEAKGYNDAAYANANLYTDTAISNLINGAPTTLDTLKEIADAMAENEEVVTALDEAIGTKANQSELDTHTGNNTIHITADERTAWNNKADASDLTTLETGIQTKLDNIQTTSKATLSQAGWYRVAEYKGATTFIKGSASNSCVLTIKQNHGSLSGEFHVLRLISVSGGTQTIVSVASKCRYSDNRSISKARYTYDSNTAYLEIYYALSVSNAISFTISDGTDSISQWQAITPTLTGETVDGVTVTTTYDIPANASPVTDLDLAQVDGSVQLNSSILEKALTLDVGVHVFRFGRGAYNGSDLPSANYKHGYATVEVVEKSAWIMVFLHGVPNVNDAKRIAFNRYNGTSWSGWDEYATTADLANYLLLTGGAVGDGTKLEPLKIKGTTQALLGFYNSAGSVMGYLGLYSANTPVFQGTDNKAKELHHDGNSAKVVAATSAPSDTTALWVDTTNKIVKAYIDGAWTNLDKDHTYSLSSFGITATAAELNKLDGVTATATELNYVDGVTSNIQTQLDGKAASSHGTHVTYGTSASALGTSSAGSATTVSRSDHVHALPALTSCTGTLTVAKGGTGATDAATARTNLGLGSAATYSATTSIASGSSALITSGAVYTALSGKLSTSGTAAAASKLTTNAGDDSTPVYFKNGIPVACTSAGGGGATVSYGTEDLVAGTSSLAAGTLYVVYE